MPAAQNASNPKSRIWVLPWGLCPRRVTIYLAEKGIEDKFEIVPVEISPSGMEEVEGKPPGTLPILELSRPSATESGRYIYQSSAILEYLEDVYGAHGPDMRGSTPQHRARTRECMDVINEAVTWMSLYIRHSSSLCAIMREQDHTAAREGLECMHKSLALLESLSDVDSPFLLGTNPRVVDCVLMASAQFAESVHHFDLVGEHPRLKTVVDAFEKRGTAVFPPVPKFLQEMEVRMNVK